MGIRLTFRSKVSFLFWKAPDGDWTGSTLIIFLLTPWPSLLNLTDRLRLHTPQKSRRQNPQPLSSLSSTQVQETPLHPGVGRTLFPSSHSRQAPTTGDHVPIILVPFLSY